MPREQMLLQIISKVALRLSQESRFWQSLMQFTLQALSTMIVL